MSGAVRAARRAGVACAALLAGACIAAAPAAAQQDSLERAQRLQLEETQRQIRENRQKASELKGQENRAVGQLRHTERELAGTRVRLRRLSQRQKNLDQQLDVTRTDLEHSIQSLAEARARLKKRLRNIYKYGPASDLEVVLSHESFAQLLARWDFLQMVAEQDRQLMEDVHDRKDRVATLETRLQGHIKQIEHTAKLTTGENQRLQGQQKTRAQQVETIKTQRESYEAAAAELERTARAIAKLLATLEARRKAAVAGGKPAPAYSGDFAKGAGALEWPVRGEVVGHFGPEVHPRFGTTINNNGIDIAAEIGTAVRCVAKGRVEYTSDDYASYGPIVIVDHGDGYRTLYAHLSEINVAVGQDLASGQIIGRVGEAGSLKGPGLHFEVRKGGSALDPATWLR
ncbi:MAG: peptidoglycan DD-metalloendopeptidase family protein [Candidatus Eisenbacteria bacterium]|uniref:Peptidoglycan DD-metalloendopeptidase family protein n=1 Tax=Eiseniibacteriota bacterium TaxID=2212470 RepID=A0A9D6QJD0_UNCEI|nr:peptidoglycan DD-metalloendopeptidase family protein [Candidatus Eisenbacteria bacterium]MBI3539046.1 peptidoglycan DD-metalloendopeptidase family protein [Candidatus Eisenbacteria bacterium]